ncbi:RNA recognition motif containing protein [Nitzschia inconspicua]|uniref:RNA recognition motif containing protein n=1 Tax=Nitzschia inconspicua TaxID=303405 RepID=A0A9K3PNR0_9STRA|nr:RNA recognition motif containing protein [Nitzschia inconspicua]
MSSQEEEFTGIGFSSTESINETTTTPTTSTTTVNPQQQPQFVPASTLSSSSDPPFVTSNDSSSVIDPIQGLSLLSSTLEAEAQSARIRAMEIVRKFQTTTSHHPPFGTSSGMTITVPKYNTPDNIVSTRETAAELKRKRDACLEKLKQREHRALVKNLEYLARVEEDRLQQRLEQIEQAKAYEQQVNENYQSFHNQRQRQGGKYNNNNNNNNLNNFVVSTSQAGIGTEQRQKVEDKRKRSTHVSTMDSVAIYVANLPASADEALLQNLFGCHGSIRKLHFYVDKTTGRPKGDALVIYSLPEEHSKSALLDSVCSQLNGCELPGSSEPLLVQPSDPLHKLKSKKTKEEETNSSNSNRNTNDQSYYGPSFSEQSTAKENTTNANCISTVSQFEPTLSNSAESIEQGKEEEDDDDDDLDNFFSSLE